MNQSPDIAVADKIIKILEEREILKEVNLLSLRKSLALGDVSAVLWRNLIEKEIQTDLALHDTVTASGLIGGVGDGEEN